MKHSKAMGLGGMLLILVLAVVFLPIVVRMIDKMEPHYVSGFQNMVDANHLGIKAPNIPQSETFQPDANTDYLCSTDASGQSCPEGTFCDGPTKSCIGKTVPGQGEPEGYYS